MVEWVGFSYSCFLPDGQNVLVGFVNQLCHKASNSTGKIYLAKVLKQ